MKIYKAKTTIETVFVSNEEGELKEDAYYFLSEEGVDAASIEIEEVKSIKDIPKDWLKCCPWGQDEIGSNNSLTAEDLLNKINKDKAKLKDPEYKQYLKLKKKFEDK